MNQMEGWIKKKTVNLRLRYACIDYGGGGLPGSGSARPGHSNNNKQHKSVITITHTNTSLDDDVCVCSAAAFNNVSISRAAAACIYTELLLLYYSQALCALASWRWLIYLSLVQRRRWCNGQPCVLNMIICRYFGRKCAVSPQNNLNQN